MKILKNKWAQFGLTLLIGVAIGAIFYPTKHIEREIESKYQREIDTLKTDRKYIEEKYSQELNKEIRSNVKYREDTSKKLSSLKTENTRLKQQVKERTLKIVKPDGTIVEETFRESQTEVVSKVVTEVRQEFDRKVSSIENKWKRVHERRVRDIKAKHEQELKQKDKLISTYKKKEEIKINPRSFGIAAGVMSDGGYYGNVSYDIFGPVFINGHIDTNKELDDNRIGGGFGLRF